MDFPNNFNNSYITDIDIDTSNLDSKCNESRKNTIISDSTFIEHSITPYNGYILWIQTPYTNIDSHNTNLHP